MAKLFCHLRKKYFFFPIASCCLCIPGCCTVLQTLCKRVHFELCSWVILPWGQFCNHFLHYFLRNSGIGNAKRVTLICQKCKILRPKFFKKNGPQDSPTYSTLSPNYKCKTKFILNIALYSSKYPSLALSHAHKL